MIVIEALKAFLIGVVEGITEWLPISSTGHMILVDEFVHLEVSPEFLKLFFVVIQLGAILAVLILYFTKLNPFAPSKSPHQRKLTWRMWGMVVIGVVPAAIVGILFDDWVNDHFYNKVTVAAMLILYGIIFILIEGAARRKTKAALHGKHARQDQMQDCKIQEPEDITWKTALIIGCFQVLAIVPGTSRSGATIIGGMLAGCSRKAATEFTFFLAIPIMFGWGLVKVAKFILKGLVFSQVELVVLITGCVTAFIMSVVAIKFLMSYLKKHDFMAFGWYRIIVGCIVLAYFALEMMHILP